MTEKGRERNRLRKTEKRSMQRKGEKERDIERERKIFQVFERAVIKNESIREKNHQRQIFFFRPSIC
jgi:hypothetical protein